MQQIIAIAIITFRNTIRSKVLACLLLLLSAVIVILPFSIRGDGTVSGFVQILLSYTLGLSGFILILTTLWAGSASISTEVADRTIQMAVTKPLGKYRLWIGKWLGINILNALLLAGCGLTTVLMLQWHLTSGSLKDAASKEEAHRILTAREVFVPETGSIESAAKQQLAERLKDPSALVQRTEQELFAEIRQQLFFEKHTVRPGGSLSWTFPTLQVRPPSAIVTLQYRFTTSQIGQGQVSGRWRIGTPGQPDLMTIEKSGMARTLNEIQVELDNRWATEPLVLTYEDIDSGGAALIFDADKLAMLVPRGGFAANYIRTLLVMLGGLSFFAALGVSTGCLFSLPVAAFMSMFLLIMIKAGSYIQGIAKTPIALTNSVSGEQAMSWLTVIVMLVFKCTALLIAPVIQDNPLEFVSTGRLVSGAWTASALLMQGFIYPVLLGWIASLILDRRELALPST